MAGRRALLQHVWAMVQTRAEAAGLVLQLQQAAWRRGLAWYGIAAVASLALVMTLVLLVALGTPAAYRAGALVLLAAVLLAALVACVSIARRQWARDAALVSDFRAGLKLDLALVNLALRDPEATDEDARLGRERARAAVREAVDDRAGVPATGEGVVVPDAGGPDRATATAAARADTPVATEIEPTAAPLAPPEALQPPPAPDPEESRRATA